MKNQEQIARGVIIHDQKILLCKNLELGYYFLPGGHIEKGEIPEEAFKREMIEELGKDVLSTKKISSFKNTYTQQGVEYNEVVYLYSAELENYESIKSLENHIAFDWIELANLVKVDLRPQKIINELIELSDRK